MALIIPDLGRDITFRSVSLNNVAASLVAGRTVLIGNRVDSMLVGPPELVQFTEKLALTDGMDYGGVWFGARLISIRGVTLDSTRGLAHDRLAALEAVSLPASGTFGLYALAFSAMTGSAGTASAKSIMVRPNGLQVPVDRDKEGGRASNAIGIAWTITFTAMDPALS